MCNKKAESPETFSHVFIRGIWRQQYLIEHMICNVRYCHQVVISSATPRQIKSGEYTAYRIYCFANYSRYRQEEYNDSLNQV